MPHITIARHDGEYTIRTIDLPEAPEAPAAPAENAGNSDALSSEENVLYVEDAVLRAWRRHEDDHAAWGAHWRAIENEQHVQRRIAALRPLEDAEARIRELEEEVLRLSMKAMPPANLATKDGLIDVRHRRNGAVLAHGTTGLLEVMELAARNHQDLDWAALANANLHGARLVDVLLEAADLTNANLSFADLTGANLAGALLARANLGHANLENASLHDANLEAANLAYVNLDNAFLGGARMNGVQMFSAILRGTILRGATLRDATLIDTDFTGADFARADLRGAVGLVATEAQLASMAYRP